MKSNYEKLGGYIRLVDERNKDCSITRLLGVSIEKSFIESIANTIGTDMSTYKIVKKGQFAYGPVTSRNGDKISIALLEEDECIISSSYSVFEIIDTSKLLPEYLNLWFKRPEFDRYARFHSHGSAREIFDWAEMCNVELPIPEIDEQIKIINAYKAIEHRIALKRRINDNLAAQISTIYTNQKGDKFFVVSDECRIFTGKKDVNQATSTGRYKFFSCSPSYLYSDDYIYDGKAVLVAGNGSYTGRTTFVDEKFDLYQRTYGIVPKDSRNDSIIYLVYAAMAAEFVKKTKESLHGSAIPYIVYNDIANFEIYYSDNPTVICDKISVLINAMIRNNTEINSLTELQEVLLCKMSD